MKRTKNIWLVCPYRRAASTGCQTVLLLLLAALSTQAAFSQTGFTGVSGGGPFYINATSNIREMENSGFTEVIVWSVEVNSIGDLNLNGEISVDLERHLHRRPDPS